MDLLDFLFFDESHRLRTVWRFLIFGAGFFVVQIIVSLIIVVGWVALHFAWNFSQGVVFGIPISGLATTGFYHVLPDKGLPQWLTGGEFGLEATAPMAAAQGALAVVFLIWMRQNELEASRHTN